MLLFGQPMCPQWYITFWATTKIGAVLVTVNTAYKIHEAEYLLRQSDTHTLVMIDGYKDSNYVEIIKELCPELETAEEGRPLHIKRLPFLRNIITVDSKTKRLLYMGRKLSVGGSGSDRRGYSAGQTPSINMMCVICSIPPGRQAFQKV